MGVRIPRQRGVVTKTLNLFMAKLCDFLDAIWDLTNNWMPCLWYDRDAVNIYMRGFNFADGLIDYDNGQLCSKKKHSNLILDCKSYSLLKTKWPKSIAYL